MDRNIDYGSGWAYNHKLKKFYKVDERTVLQQLKFFYQKDLEKKYSTENLYIKAFILHHLLDYFRETRVDIYDLSIVFKKFLQEKILVEFEDDSGNHLNFQKEVNEIFQLIKENKEELYNDLNPY